MLSNVAAFPPSAEVIYPAPFVTALLLRDMFADPSKETPAIVLAVASLVAVAAFPEVFWFPEVLTPGKFILPVPSNDTPPIFRAVSRAVAVDAFHVVS